MSTRTFGQHSKHNVVPVGRKKYRNVLVCQPSTRAAINRISFALLNYMKSMLHRENVTHDEQNELSIVDKRASNVSREI